MLSLSTRPVLVSALLVLATCLGYFFTRLYHHRMIVIRLKKKGLPVAPNHNFFLGHLWLLKKYSDRLPGDAHYQYVLGDIYTDHFQNDGAYYVDLWPVSGLCLAVLSPHMATAMMQNPKLSMQRPVLLPRFFKPIAGGSNLFDMNEADWRPWRAVFTKGFNTDHFLSLVPGMVKESRVYVETLKELARKGDMFYLDIISLRFMMDMIGKTILNAELGAQNGYNTLADCMISQIRWQQPSAETNPLGSVNVARWFMQWWNGRQMDRYIGDELDRRYAEFKSDSNNTRSKAVIDIILQAYIEDSKAMSEKLDPEFRAFAIRQIRLFVFVGHDSTSSTICYCLHLLSQNPSALAKVRAEHDDVFGKDLSAVSNMLISQPHLSSDLPYTTAVIKETLRLFPPASCSRQGKRDVSLTDDDGHVCPTDDVFVLIIHNCMQRAPRYWPRASEFLPERFLVEPGHELYPVKGSWRAFEYGPRNCIAQGLVMTEMRVVLAHIVRAFDFSDCYKEWDEREGRQGLKTVWGDRAYQIDEGAAHPNAHYPCRVALRK